MKEPKFILNERTNRYVKIDSRKGKELYKKQKMADTGETSESRSKEQATSREPPLKLEIMKSTIVPEIIDEIKGNPKEYRADLSKEELDSIVKKMLYKKLVEKNKKLKKEKKVNKRIKKNYYHNSSASSDESSDSSDSDF